MIESMTAIAVEATTAELTLSPTAYTAVLTAAGSSVITGS